MAAASSVAGSGGGAKPLLRGVVFDMDGTLTVPNLDFKVMYGMFWGAVSNARRRSRASARHPRHPQPSPPPPPERCGVDASDDLLAAIATMPADKAAAANAVIDEMEAEGRRTLQLEKGVAELARWLQFHNIPTALVRDMKGLLGPAVASAAAARARCPTLAPRQHHTRARSLSLCLSPSL